MSNIKDRIEKHPCYCAEAHFKYARIHLPVAPKCNIQCNYCNRKYDCSNESRPGITSKLLTPEDALERLENVDNEISNLSVVGIAGPGDPLANAKKTFETLKMAKEYKPELKLCLSTNGLLLEEHIDEIINLNIEHITVTVNTINPETALKIYNWFMIDGKRYKDLGGAKIFIKRQREGIKKLVQNDIIVKINTVLIPEINSSEISDISFTIKKLGVFIHNILPLISKPEYGTVFGMNNVREPSHDELDKARNDSASQMGGFSFVMRHCKQCRADAIGMLGDDQSQKFQNKETALKSNDRNTQLTKLQMLNKNIKVRFAATSSNQTFIDQHFGSADRFHIYETDGKKVEFIETRSISTYCEGENNCSDKKDKIELLVEAVKDCSAVVCVRCGYNPKKVLNQHNIYIIEDFAFKSVKEALLMSFNVVNKNKQM